MMASHVYCPHCGTALPPHMQTCHNCGKSLAAHLSRGNTAQHAVDPSFASLLENHLLKQRYRIARKSGRGGYGDVYMATDTEMADRRVAVKEMRQRGLDASEIARATEAFKREAFLLAGLTHPNLPSIYDYFTENGRWYLVMSFIEGETLEEYLAKQADGRLRAKEVLAIALQLCSVLDYLHTRNPPIIFRDLKPANVMYTEQKQLYLIDFGIARHFKQGQAKDTMALGSPGYAAPEQYGRRQSSPQTDIYSLGATLHQLLSGIDPSNAPFTHLPLDLPGYRELGVLITFMLDMDDARRPTSIAGIQQSLRYIASGHSSHKAARQVPPPQAYVARQSAPPMPSQQSVSSSAMPHYVNSQQQPQGQLQLQQQKSRQAQAQKPQNRLQQQTTATPADSRNNLSRRNVLVGAAGLAVGGLLVGAYLTMQQSAYPSPPHLRSFGTDLAVPGIADAGQNLPEALLAVAWSPDNTRIASANHEGVITILNAANRQIILTYSGHTSAGVPATSASVAALTWSPDARHIASAGYDTTVQIWDPASGSKRATYRGHNSPVLALAWSPDGKHIVSADATHHIHVWEAATLNTVLTNDHLHTQQITALAWSPNNKYIVSGSTDRTAQVWNAATGKLVFSYQGHTDGVEAVAWSPDGKHIASASDDKTVQIWDAQNGSIALTYQGHSNRVWAVAWSPDSGRIVSGSWDKTAQVWSARNGGNVYVYRNHKNYVLSVMWSPDGKHIASGDADGNLEVWMTGWGQ